MRQRPGGSIDSFSTFLRTVKTSVDASAGNNAAAPITPNAANGRSWERMVTILADRGPVPVPDLMKETGLGFSDFSAALQAATDNEMIRIRAGNGTEVAELTPFGRKLASLK